MNALKHHISTSYHGLPNTPYEEDEQPLRPKQQFELGDHPQLVQSRRHGITILIQLLTALWLVPIVALLYLNVTGQIIGASAWCPGGKCFVDTWNPMIVIPQGNIARFSKNDHNLLGGLQLVAKALEIWFIAICAAFVYLITMHLASKREGIPVGYLTVSAAIVVIQHYQLMLSNMSRRRYSDGLIISRDRPSSPNPLLWKTGPSPFAGNDRDRTVGRRAWFLIGLTVYLCLLCNLMGPATAVLAIPSLQWIGTNEIGSRRFGSSHASEAPGVHENSWFSQQAAYLCTPAELRALNYSCAFDTIGRSLDAWLGTYLGSHGNIGYSQELGLTFDTNVTAHFSSHIELEQNTTDYTFWMMNRQTLTNMTYDRNAIARIAKGQNFSTIVQEMAETGQPIDAVETYAEYNKSLATELHRIGPITGFMSTAWIGQQNSSLPNNVTQNWPWTIEVDATRMIRCYSAYIPGWAPMELSSANLEKLGAYIKCIRIGSGWSDYNKAVGFYVPQEYDALSETSKDEQSQALGVRVSVYSSDRAVFFPNGTLPSWLSEACLTAGSLTVPIQQCDYERLFSEPAPPRVTNRTENIVTIEYEISDGENSAWIVSDFVAWSAFTTYTLDTSPLSNPSGYVRLHDLPVYPLLHNASVRIDPTWVLAGWAVGNGGSLQLGRLSGRTLLDVMTSIYKNGWDETWFGDSQWNVIPLIDYLVFVPVAHSLSLIDYQTEAISESTEPDEDHPWLYRTASIYVWGYFMASRTAIMGVCVCGAGCLIVLAQLYLGFKDKRRYRSPTQLMVAALEHIPKGEFEGKSHDEKALARVPFHIEENDTKIVRFSSEKSGAHSTHTWPSWRSTTHRRSSGHSRMSSAQTLYSPPSAGYSPSNNQGYFASTGGFSPWQGGGPGVPATTIRSFVW